LKLTQNIWRTKRRIKRYVSAGMYVAGVPAFATFTYAKPQHDVERAIEDWRQFTRRMKKQFPSVAFLRVPERHKSGAIHFHAVMFGLPSNLPCILKKRDRWWVHHCSKKKRCERQLRTLRNVWKRGHVDLSRARKPEALGVYLGKYLTKGEPDWTLFGCHVASANSRMYQILREAREAGVLYEMSSFYGNAVGMILDDMEEVLTPLKVGQFETRWLGQARYELSRVDGVVHSPGSLTRGK
jgi:hypothetical protein